MTHILVSGHINIETTLQIDGFPYSYTPVRYPFFGVNSTVAGVGYNIAKALTTLGDEVSLLSIIGDDPAGMLVRDALTSDGIDDSSVVASMPQTCGSVILYDSQGKRSINTDLKDIQEREYPVQSFEQALSKTDLAVLCNINFSRAMLNRTHRRQVKIATDVHAIGDLDDDYNRDFMRHAHILFQSHENLPDSPENWIRQLWHTYGTPVAVVGLGADGALLGVKRDNFLERIPAVYTRPVVNTVGAGDSLFSAFIHTYADSDDPYLAIKKAVVFASYKIGATGAADGFLDSAALDDWYTRTRA